MSSVINMSGMTAVWRRQFGSLIGNPLGYVFILAFVLISAGILFLPDAWFSRGVCDLGPLQALEGAPIMAILLSVLVPALAMGAWSTERDTGTEELLLTMPLSLFDALLGKYLAVVAMPQRAGDASYALTACDGECTANVCLEWVNGAFEAYAALNVLNRTEANFIEGGFRAELAQSLVIRTGSCGSQSRACTRERKPVCASVAGTRVAPQTMQNLCLAKGLLYDASGDKLGPRVLTATAGACQ